MWTLRTPQSQSGTGARVGHSQHDGDAQQEEDVPLLLPKFNCSGCFAGVLWGMRESAVSDSGSRHWFFFWVGGIGNGKRKCRDPWSSSYVHCMSNPQTAQIYVFMFCVMSYII